MEGLAGCSVGGRSLLRFPSAGSRRRSLPHHGRPGFYPAVRASRGGDGPELDKWDQMELKFGRLLGEDPKLTLAKIMARKANPDVSYLDVEKSFKKNKGKLDDCMINVPLDMTVEGQHSGSPNRTYLSSQKGAESMPQEGTLKLSRPLMNRVIKATRPDEKPAVTEKQPNHIPGNSVQKSGISDIALRKPTVFQDDDIEINSKMKIKPNLFLKMKKGSSEYSSNITLLNKPEVMKMPLNSDQENVSFDASIQSNSSEIGAPDNDVKLLKPIMIPNDKMTVTKDVETSEGCQQNNLDMSSTIGMMAVENDVTKPLDGLQPPKQNGVETHDVEASTTALNHNSVKSSDDTSKQASLLGKPQRLDSSVKEASHPATAEKVVFNYGDHDYETRHVITAEQEGIEDGEWKKAQDLLQTGEKVEVELISCSSRGFVVSFGSFIGFLPYRNLGAKWKFLAFESWLRKKGLDPSLYRQHLSILGTHGVNVKNRKSQETSQKDEVFPPDMKFEYLLEAYDQEKTKFLSSFIGQRIRVSVILVDRNSRKLMFSGRPKEKEELVQKKRSLMARLSIGDVIKCRIKKITFFGIFVEVEGVPALIHQSEVSWDATLDSSSFYKIGQIVEAKVHQLDYALERITLSLKEIMPNPLMEALESVVGERRSVGESLEAGQPDIEWADVESLIKELQKIDGVSSVSKGRFFLSPGLTPTFQVYMASTFDDEYKLLARYENKVQEVVVQSSLDKEQMKAAILTCTNRVG
ncbi:uncharacterized protein LOC103719423 isoform X2 [Phoenix dactylifera]|uniref:Uncharacterized protein LOC103719423 isoform X2 n=1 Tax=Phoenix dactylifera TaxID=42345 RepID=A0A8B8ZAK3_PHODC|nr:uncharacterized protein LOC103719423 isoform X2 [Phoenix dactylifera]